MSAPFSSSWLSNPRFLNLLGMANSFMFLLLVASCRTSSPLPPANLAEPGWTVRQGQAVWRSKAGAPEIAGEVVLATRADGRTFTQFTKTPLPFLVAQTTANAWQIEFAADNRKFAGRGSPPTRLAWLHLARSLSGVNPPKGWWFTKGGDGSWHLENPKTGEMVEGYLAP
jgi:hypothetical protein